MPTSIWVRLQAKYSAEEKGFNLLHPGQRNLLWLQVGAVQWEPKNIIARFLRPDCVESFYGTEHLYCYFTSAALRALDGAWTTWAAGALDYGNNDNDNG